MSRGEYFIVRNIPPSWRSHHVRNFFYHSVEEGHFRTFHFKHRKEINICDLQIDSKDTREQCCCLIELEPGSSPSVLSFYNNRNWVFTDGRVTREKCIILRVKVKCKNEPKSLKSVKERRKECRERSVVEFTADDLADFQELNPPRHTLPRGNVGTTDDQFRHLISKCRLSTAVIKSLKLTFTRTKPYRRYQRLNHNYNDNIITPPQSHRIIETKSGHEIQPDKLPEISKIDEKSDTTEHDETVVISSDDEEDDFGMEGWEIHQSLNDDDSLARRDYQLTEDNIASASGTKERSFESDIELTWEKGGSGLVFYTDEAYWRATQSDGDIFDEEGFVQWGQDNSAFYDPHGGDKDAKDFIDMQRHRLRRRGIPEEKLTIDLIQSFGGKILKKQGWNEGETIGDNGLLDPLIPSYRHPKNVRGLGYHGVKLKDKKIIFPQRKRAGPIQISTIFDSLTEEDELAELVHRRAPNSMLKRRQYEGSTVDYVKSDFPAGSNVLLKSSLEQTNSKPSLFIPNAKIKKLLIEQPFIHGGVIQ